MTSESDPELEGPLEEHNDSPVPGLTHRYPDRVLMGHHARLDVGQAFQPDEPRGWKA